MVAISGDAGMGKTTIVECQAGQLTHQAACTRRVRLVDEQARRLAKFRREIAHLLEQKEGDIEVSSRDFAGSRMKESIAFLTPYDLFEHRARRAVA